MARMFDPKKLIWTRVIPGKVEQHLLVNASSQDEAEKFQVKASFDLSGSSYPVKTIFSESQLNLNYARVDGMVSKKNC